MINPVMYQYNNLIQRLVQILPLTPRFQLAWCKIDTKYDQPRIKDNSVLKKLRSSVKKMLEFCLNQLKLPYYRRGYYQKLFEIIVTYFKWSTTFLRILH